jgi:GNAT superfamily N-acetyltransferase
MTNEPTIRRATAEDVEACHSVMWASVIDLGARKGTPVPGTVDEWWTSGEPLHRLLAAQAAEWWVAEGPEEIVGYARSIERGGLFELTEFFVVPGSQSRGIGRALIEHAFPAGRGEVRSIIATTEVRALSRYYRAGTVARFPILTLEGPPAAGEINGDLTARPVDPDSETDRSAIAGIERSVVGFTRGETEIRWLLRHREGYLYLRGTAAVGFAFVGGGGTGPIAAADPEDLPGILLHVENRAVAQGLERIELQVPAPNEVATRHLLGRGFRFDPWVNVLMSNRPFGRFDRLIPFGPPVFL